MADRPSKKLISGKYPEQYREGNVPLDIGPLYDALPELDLSRCPWCAELVDECTCIKGTASAIWTGRFEDTA